MLFRIEDTENDNGCHRQYTLACENLPRRKLSELEIYIAKQVRKEINNAADRKLLSYSKSLGVCLLKYNKFTDNELHISDIPVNSLWYYDCKNQFSTALEYDICYGLPLYERNPNKKIILENFCLDVSNNLQVDCYLKKHTGKGRKKLASPEKDKEVLIMQSPNDLIISQYSSSVYLLYALVRRYGMNENIFHELYKKIETLDEYRFSCCDRTERIGLLTIVKYLYYNRDYECNISNIVFQDSIKESHNLTYYDPILQLLDIQNDDFEDSYILGDYNSNIISEWIWEYYRREHV